MNGDEIDNRFGYHRSDEAKALAHENYCEAVKALVHTANALLPDGREKALVMTHLEDATFWGNAAIARSHDD